MFDFLTIGEALAYTVGGKAILVDVRPEHDYLKGHLPGAVNVPLNRIEDGSFVNHPMLKGTALKVILYCETGTGSIMAARRLDREGYDACSISGGIGGYKGQLDTGYFSK